MISADIAMAGKIAPEFAMDSDPLLYVPPDELRLPDRLVELWQQALQRPESDLQRLAAEAVAQAADEGLSGLDSVKPQLRAIVGRQESHPSAVHAAARALIALDDRRSSGSLLDAGREHGRSVRLLVESALAEWKYVPAGPVWRDRLEHPRTGRRDLILALEGLASLQDPAALNAMLKIVHSPELPADVRLAAARAAGAVVETDLDSEAEGVSPAEQSTRLQKLLAVALLQRQTTPRAIKQLERLATDIEPAVARPALARLLEIDPQLALPLAEGALQSRDPNLRRQGAVVYVALPTAERIGRLAELLDDPHPDVREGVRDDLLVLAAKSELREAVVSGGMHTLTATGWRGQEQAALLLGALDHEPAAARLIELLDAERPEVMVATAWVLRKLAADETRGPLLEHVRRQTQRRQEGKVVVGLDEQVAHLIEALGLMHERAAEPLLREYIPKQPANGYYSRGAAIWALGLLHAGTPDEQLATRLMERLNDVSMPNPELDIVWNMSAVSIGRMQAVSQLPALRTRMASASAQTLLAVRWSLEQLTGQQLPPLPPTIRYRTNWFLEPIGVRTTSPAEP